MPAVRLAAKSLRCLNKIIKPSLTTFKVSSFYHLDAMRYPVDDKCFGPVIPERVVNLVPAGVNHIKPLLLGRIDN